jgi:RNA polymerase sigma factor (sigma-70 family)
VRKHLSGWEAEVEVPRDDTNEIALAVTQALHSGGDMNSMLLRVQGAVERAKSKIARDARKERRRRSREKSIDDVRPEPAAPDLARRAELASMLADAISRLRDAEAGVIESMFIAGMTRAEVASSLGVSPNAVDHLRKDALDRLREMPGLLP